MAAKLDLQKKTEVKEQLAEHLCAIIQQNELRKARKLEELMLQLELSTEQARQGEQEEGGRGEREGPAHPHPGDQTEVKSGERIQTDRVEAKTSEGQEKAGLTAAACSEG